MIRSENRIQTLNTHFRFMTPFISVIIPNRNGAATIESCLQAAMASEYPRFEVLVVDDCSQDDSVARIRKFPCRLICLDRHAGAGRARNLGAWAARGDVLFFTDADCLLQPDTLAKAGRAMAEHGPGHILGGTYTKMPYDRNFFSIFQSVFIHYSETKTLKAPDYVATHALVMDTRAFRETGGFPEDFMPILEDVEFSHRVRRQGLCLSMLPQLVVQHIFHYSLRKSLRNAVRKSMYWTAYSLGNRDLLADSGTASLELKSNVLAYFLSLFLLVLFGVRGEPFLLYLLAAVFSANCLVNRRLLRAFGEAQGLVFALLAALYYTQVYPLAVGAGAGLGLGRFLLAGRRV